MVIAEYLEFIMNEIINDNTKTCVQAILNETQKVSELIHLRYLLLKSQDKSGTSPEEIQQSITDWFNSFDELDMNSAYAIFLREYGITFQERILISLLMAVEVNPGTRLVISNIISEYNVITGGKKTANLIQIDVRFWYFILHGTDNESILIQFRSLNGFDRIFKEEVVKSSGEYGALSPHDELSLSPNYFSYFLGGEKPRFDHGMDFPASLAQTHMAFEDVVLSKNTHESLASLKRYINYKKQAVNLPELEGHIKPYYIGIFNGPPGTGKTITAKTIGKRHGMPTYVVNLANLVSKYIGETQKNFERIFQRFEGKNCILLFDEGDVLFGKRSEVKDAQDRYANQEIAYLLQRIESYNGIILISTNLRSPERDIDQAFQRRISCIVHFGFPLEDERKMLWKKALPANYQYAEGALEDLAKNYQVAGGHIINAMSESLTMLLETGSSELTVDLLEKTIFAESAKRGAPKKRATDEEASRNPQFRLGFAAITGKTF